MVLLSYKVIDLYVLCLKYLSVYVIFSHISLYQKGVFLLGPPPNVVKCQFGRVKRNIPFFFVSASISGFTTIQCFTTILTMLNKVNGQWVL